MTKNNSQSQSDVIFLVMNALVNVLVNEVLVPHCHLNRDCQESRARVSSGLFQSADDCHKERSRVSSELIQSVGGCQSERSRVWSEPVQSADGCQLERSRVWSETLGGHTPLRNPRPSEVWLRTWLHSSLSLCPLKSFALAWRFCSHPTSSSPSGQRLRAIRCGGHPATTALHRSIKRS